MYTCTQAACFVAPLVLKGTYRNAHSAATCSIAPHAQTQSPAAIVHTAQHTRTGSHEATVRDAAQLSVSH